MKKLFTFYVLCLMTVSGYAQFSGSFNYSAGIPQASMARNINAVHQMVLTGGYKLPRQFSFLTVGAELGLGTYANMRVPITLSFDNSPPTSTHINYSSNNLSSFTERSRRFKVALYEQFARIGKALSSPSRLLRKNEDLERARDASRVLLPPREGGRERRSRPRPGGALLARRHEPIRPRRGGGRSSRGGPRLQRGDHQVTKPTWVTKPHISAEMTTLCRGERIRTSDSSVPNRVRYQAALRPVPRQWSHALSRTRECES